jgi:hypothetical protein
MGRLNTYYVLLDGKHVGTWQHEEPEDWDWETRHFMRNDSSWCTNNMRSHGTLDLDEGVTIPFDPVDSDVRNLCCRVELVPKYP